MSAAREALRIELAEDLRVVPAVLCDQTSLIDLVLDSMHAMRWLNTFRKRGFKVTMRELYLQPTLAGWQSLLDEKAPAHTPARQPPNAVALPTMRDGQDFPLTPVQHAYLVGRDPGQALGGVGCHLYQEFDGPGREGRRLEAAALREAVRALRRRHPMLCTAFRADGTQRYIGNPDDVRLAVHDLRDLGPEAVQRRLLDLRERLGHRQLAVERGETLDLQLSLLPDDTHRLHVNLDLLVADAASFTLLFDELAALVAGRDLSAVPADYDFRSYIADLAQRTEVDRQAAEAFWRRRLDDLPAAPSLPLARDPSRHDAVRIKRRTHRIDGDDWQQFAGKARAGGVTPTMALATGFGQVIGRWSGQARLLLNLTLFDRQPLHPAVERMIADFTTILLLDLNLARIPFLDLVRRNQTTFAEAHEHRHRTGVEVARDLKRAGRHPHGAPVVFTSALGRPLFGEASAEALGDPGAGISQTPQVWIDHLVYEHAGAVHLQWDSNDALFPEHLVAGMFDGYVDLVRGLIADESAWDCPLPDALPPTQLATRRRVNATAAEQPAGLLHDGIFARGSSTPDAVAVIHGEDTLSYADLCDLAERLAASLAAEGVERGDHVAICMDKGLGQIVAALGILYAGGIYVPVASQQPEERRKIIYDGVGIDLVAGGVPVVFTSALGFDTRSFLNHASWLKPRWGISQTPQVWLDHQVYESDGALCFNWDFVEALFAAETIDGMFGRYVELLRRLAGDAGAWTQALDALVPRQATIVPFAPRPFAPRPVAIATMRSATSADVEIVTCLFGEVVGQPIGPAQNFFEAGASSLQLVKLHAALRRHGHEIEVIDLFAHPTPRALAARIAGAVDSAGPDGGVTGADRAAAAAPAIDRTPALQRRRDRLQRRLEQRR